MKAIGTIYVIAAASGTGKTSLVSMMSESLQNIVVSISCTTRPKRTSERDDENYFFISEQQFTTMIENNEFLEHAKVFKHHYGTEEKWVDDKINQGMDVILEIDWQGFQQVKQKRPECVSIFILPPSIEELRNRLKKRNQDPEQVINERLAGARLEISHCSEFDFIVINDNFDIALVDLRSIIRAQRLRKSAQLLKQQQLLAKLQQKQ